MKSSTLTRLSISLAVAAAAGVYVFAGDINPPAGPVAPTMHSNEAIYNAVQNLGSVGGGDSCAAQTVPGSPRGVGLFTFASLPGPGPSPASFVVLAHEQTTTSTVSSGGGGGGVGVTSFSPFIITRDADDNSFRIFRVCATGAHVPSATLVLNDGAQDYLQYTFSDVIISSVTTRQIPRCDGTTAHVEDVAIRMDSIRVTNLITGGFYEWNVQTNTGSGS